VWLRCLVTPSPSCPCIGRSEKVFTMVGTFLAAAAGMQAGIQGRCETVFRLCQGWIVKRAGQVGVMYRIVS
jgi:hypothetical protein